MKINKEDVKKHGVSIYKLHIAPNVSATINYAKDRNGLVYKNRHALAFILLPIFIWLFYAILIQSPRYDSSAVISIQKNQQGMSGLSMGSLLGGIAGNDTSTSSQVVIDYINSYAMYQALNRQLHLTKLLQSHKIDYISRLTLHPDQKDLVSYYQSLLTVFYNPDSQTIEVSFQGYSPEQAQKILNQIIVNVQSFVNNLDQQLTDQKVDFSQKQVEIAQRKLRIAEANIIKFQNNKNILDPKTQMGVVAGIMANLQSQLVMAQTSLADKSAYYQPGSIDIQALQQKVNSIKKQISIQRQKLLGLGGNEGGNPKLNTVIADFEELDMQAKIAVTEYAASLQSLELAKSEAIQQKQQVVIIQPPILPDYNQYPRTWYNAMIMLFILSMAYGIIRMFVRIVLEHQY